MKKISLKFILVLLMIVAVSCLNAQGDWSPGMVVSSDPCIPGASPWVLGGNIVNMPPPGNSMSNNPDDGIQPQIPQNNIGTCNNAAFILKANNFKSVFIQPSGYIGINTDNPLAPLDIMNPNPAVRSNFRIFGDNMGTVQTLGHMNLVYGSTADFIISEGVAFGNPTDHFTIHNGNIGIDEPGPNEKLEVNGNTRIRGNLGVGAYPALEKLHIASGNARVDGHVGVGGAPTVAETVLIQDPNNAVLKVATYGPNNAELAVENTNCGYVFYADGGGVGHIKSHGTGPDMINFKPEAWPQHASVWIGGKPTTNHLDFLFAVDGKMVAKSLYLTLNCGWADYVFAPGYKLPKLEDVENYYRTNKHLPEIPSAKEVEEDGVDVLKMNILLLKKVEELTLYVVNQQKEIDKLKESQLHK